MAKSTAVINPNLGLYFDRSPLALPPRALQDGFNFRIKEGNLNNLNLGWERFGAFTLNGPVLLIDNFKVRGQAERLIFATETDIYSYDGSDESVAYLTPRYATGTASASGTTVTGTGTTWTTNAKSGDEIHFGANDQTDPDAVWYEILSVTDNDTLVLTTSAGVIANGNYTIRKKFTGDADDIWVTDVFVNNATTSEDEWWATNGIDDIVRWNGQDDQVEVMSSLNFKAKTLTVFANMMIFGNITQGGSEKPQDIINSDVGSSDDVSGGLSEQFKVHGGSDAIMALRSLGDNLAIYSEHTVTIAAFVGGDLIFAFRNAANGVGTIARKAIADYGAHHEFIGHDSMYLFDGVTVREVNEHIWRDLLRQQDPTRVTRAYAQFDDENGEVVWVMPSTADTDAGSSTAAPSRAAVGHYLEDVGQQNPTPYSLRSFPFFSTGYYFRQDGLTWDDLSSAWSTLNFRWNDQFFFAAFPFILGGDKDGKIYTVNTAQDADGAALTSFVKFGRRAIDGRMRGLVTRVYPFVSPFNNDLDITLYMSDHAGGNAAITHTEAFDQNLPEGLHYAAFFRRGRFMELEFGTDGPGQPWAMEGYDFDVKPGGRR